MSMAATLHDSDTDSEMLDELDPGATLLHGQYTIERFLNSGGFGITYLARDSLSRQVVIKECFPSSFCHRIGSTVGVRSRAYQTDFQSAVKSFIKEAWSLSKLKHPHIVGVHQVFEDNDTAYMALDYIDGYDLLQSLEDDSRALSPTRLRIILEKILGAVGFIHTQNMLHRDISPDNILLDPTTGDPVLIDFGAARDEASKSNVVLSEMRVIKDGYSPQEFYVNSSKEGPASDLYALGATFYHLIAGTPPPVSQARLLAIASQQPDPYVPLDEAIKGYDPAFLDAINKSLAVLPRDRLQSAKEWLDLIVPASGAKENTGELAAVRAAINAANMPEEKIAAASSAAAVPSSKHADAAAVTPKAARQTGGKPLLLVSVALIAIVAALGIAVTQTELLGGDTAVAPTLPKVASAPVAPAPAPVVQPVAPVPATAAETPKVAATVAPVVEEAAPVELAPEVDVAVLAPVEPTPDLTQDNNPPVMQPGMVLPEGVELIAPALAAPEGEPEVAPDPEVIAAPPEPEESGEVAALDVVDAPDPAAEIAPMQDVPQEVLPVESNAPALAGTGLVSAQPSDIGQAARLSTELAMSTITDRMTVQLPFFGDGGASNVITKLAPGAADWMAVGHQIVDVNRNSMRALNDIPTLLQAEIEAATAANQSALEVAFGVKAFPGADVVHKTASLPIVPEISVTNGPTFQIVETDQGPRPLVTGLPAGNTSELQVGDIVTLYLAGTERIEVGGDFETLLMREIALGVRRFNFAVNRDDAIWLASFRLDMNN